MASKRVLLDSHALLFAASDPERLTAGTRQLLKSESCHILVSVVSLWELLLKANKGKLGLGLDPAGELKEYCRRLRAEILPIKAEHAYESVKLEALHKDPFDRMLVAQARVEQLALVTRDAAIGEYDVETIW